MFLSRITPVLVVVALCGMGYAHEPVTGPNFAGCGPMSGAGSQPYAPLPQFDVTKPGGIILTWPAPGSFDFCAYLDTAYCSLGPVANLDARVLEFGGLLQCLVCDLNGPLNASEEIPFTPNGFLDGSCELAVVAAVLNNPAHPLHEEAMNKFQENVYITKELLIEALGQVPGFGDLRPTLKTMAPYLARSLAGIIAAYGLMDDDMTYSMLDALVAKLSILGMEPVEGGVRSLLSGVSDLSIDGDANGDGFTNREAYHYYVGLKGYDCRQFAVAAADPDQPIRLAALDDGNNHDGGANYIIGDPLLLSVSYDSDALELVDGENGFVWSKNGQVIPGHSERFLEIEALTLEDSGLYEVSFSVRILLDGNKGDVEIITQSFEVQVNWPVPLYHSLPQLLLLIIILSFLLVFSRYYLLQPGE